MNETPAPIRTLIVDDETLARKLVRSLVSHDPAVQIIGECANGEQALAEIQGQRPELVFLDVRMPLLDGMQLVKRLAADEQTLPYIIFLTAFDDYAIKAFEYNALDYLVKPVQKARFRQSLERAKQAIRQRELCGLTERIVALSQQATPEVAPKGSAAESLVVWRGAQAVNVNFNDIVWVEAANQYVRIHLADADYLLTESLSSFYRKLNRPQFQRVHRSAVINTACLQQVIKKANGTHQLVLRGNVKLPLARSRKALLPELLRLSQAGEQ